MRLGGESADPGALKVHSESCLGNFSQQEKKSWCLLNYHPSSHSTVLELEHDRESYSRLHTRGDQDTIIHPILHLSPLIPILRERKTKGPLLKRVFSNSVVSLHHEDMAFQEFSRANGECVCTVGQCRHGTDNIRTSLEQKRWVALHISSRVSTLASSRFPIFFRLDLPPGSSTSPHPPLPPDRELVRNALHVARRIVPVLSGLEFDRRFTFFFIHRGFNSAQKSTFCYPALLWASQQNIPRSPPSLVRRVSRVEISELKCPRYGLDFALLITHPIIISASERKSEEDKRTKRRAVHNPALAPDPRPEPRADARTTQTVAPAEERAMLGKIAAKPGASLQSATSSQACMTNERRNNNAGPPTVRHNTPVPGLQSIGRVDHYFQSR